MVLNNKNGRVHDAAVEHGKGLWDGVLKMWFYYCQCFITCAQ